jgi:outer membrane protein assembly factor BamB
MIGDTHPIRLAPPTENEKFSLPPCAFWKPASFWSFCMRRLSAAVALSIFVCVCQSAFAQVKTGDWPQWRGPQRDAISAETGLLAEWPAAGPKVLWDARKVNGGQSVGVGFSSLAIVKGKIFTMGDVAPKKGIAGGYLFCLDAETGKEIWKTKVGPKEGDGPRSTPTVDGDFVYGLTRQGILSCLKVADGAIVWQKEFKKDFTGRMMSGWDYSESPTIDGEKLICTPGGKDAILVALNKLSGDVYWKCQAPVASGAGYASIVKAEVGGVKQYITLMGTELGLIGVDAESGKFLWSYKKAVRGTAHIPTAVVHGDHVFTSCGYGAGAALLKLSPDGKGGIKAEESYFLPGNKLQNHHGGVVMIGDYIYGGHGHNEGFPFCLDWKTGKFAWQPQRGAGTGSAAVLYADGRLYFRYESGDMALIEATPKGYNLISSFRPPIAGNGWPHPVIYHGRLYLRGNDQILCYDIRK